MGGGAWRRRCCAPNLNSSGAAQRAARCCAVPLHRGDHLLQYHSLGGVGGRVVDESQVVCACAMRGAMRTAWSIGICIVKWCAACATSGAAAKSTLQQKMGSSLQALRSPISITISLGATLGSSPSPRRHIRFSVRSPACCKGASDGRSGQLASWRAAVPCTLVSNAHTASLAAGRT